MSRIVYVLCLAVVCAGCASGSTSRSVVSPSATAKTCVAVLEWHGRDYYGRAVRELPRLGRGLGTAAVPSCTDVLGGETGASRAVEVVGFSGVEPDLAIAVRGDASHAYLAGGHLAQVAGRELERAAVQP